MIDAVISLFILLLTLTSSYELLINTNNFKEKTLKKLEIVLEESETYEKSLEDLLSE